MHWKSWMPSFQSQFLTCPYKLVEESNPLLVEGAKEAMTARWAFLKKTPERSVYFDEATSSDEFQKLATNFRNWLFIPNFFLAADVCNRF